MWLVQHKYEEGMGGKTGERYRGQDERFLLLQVKEKKFYTLGNGGVGGKCRLSSR